jgi:hypothetical protein
MSNRFGPWATSIDVGGSPQLSSFWRRRLVMLLPASRSASVLTRRTRAWLAAAAMLMLVLPTVHFVVADEPAGKTPASKETPAAKPKEGQIIYGGVVATATTVQFDDPDRDRIFLPAYVYTDICHAGVRKELAFTAKQEQELSALSRQYKKQIMDRSERLKKEFESLPPAERLARIREQRALAAKDSLAARRQIESLLTAEQLKSLRSLSFGHTGFPLLVGDQRVQKDVGLSEGQLKELHGLLDTYRRQTIEACKAQRAMEEKTLAVVTPQQWERLERIIYSGKARGTEGVAYPSTELAELQREDVGKQLNLTDAQRAKIRDISNQSQATLFTLSDWSTAGGANEKKTKEHANKLAEANRNIPDLIKADHDRIKAVLTAKQLESLQKTVVRREFLYTLDMISFSGTPDESRKKYGLLGLIDLSKEQWDELNRQHDQREHTQWQLYRDIGQSALKILSPEQQDKLLDAFERRVLGDSEEPAAQKPAAGNSGESTKSGNGVIVIEETEVDAAKGVDKPDDFAKRKQDK